MSAIKIMAGFMFLARLEAMSKIRHLQLKTGALLVHP
jgi:hypothetical protein